MEQNLRDLLPPKTIKNRIKKKGKIKQNSLSREFFFKEPPPPLHSSRRGVKNLHNFASAWTQPTIIIPPPLHAFPARPWIPTCWKISQTFINSEGWKLTLFSQYVTAFQTGPRDGRIQKGWEEREREKERETRGRGKEKRRQAVCL